MRTESRFFECDGDGVLIGALFGSQGSRKPTFENIFGSPFWDSHPEDPKVVPWDQKKLVKIFLISCSNNVILCILPTYVQKRTENSIMAKVSVTMGNIVQMVGIF